MKPKQNLSLKIKKLKSIIKGLDKLENNPEAEIISQLLKMMTDLFQEVDQRLTELQSNLLILQSKDKELENKPKK